MDSTKIEKLLSANKRTRKYFLGCFAADEIPTFIDKFPASLVINLDTKDKPGSHWVAAFVENFSKVYYFDSMGSLNCLYPKQFRPNPFCISGPNSFIYDFLNRFESVIVNKIVFQTIFTTNCAHYCIFFIHAMSVGIPFNKITSMLNNNSDPNNFVFQFVNNILNGK